MVNRFDTIDYIYDKTAPFSLSATVLKIIAIVTMIIDHIGYLILNGKLYGFNEAVYQHVITLPEAQKWIVLYNVCRIIGRISFPIFAFLVIEGVLRTSSILSYLFRLFVIALVSEIPYDLMIYNRFMYLGDQNVVFLYFIVVGIISIYRRINAHPIYLITMTLVAMIVSYFAKISYGPMGILYMVYVYNTRFDKNLRTIGCGILSFLMSFYKNRYGVGAVSAIFIHLYNGKKGNLKLGNLPYIIYPLHMIIIVIIIFISYL